jgi:hypothetical protein
MENDDKTRLIRRPEQPGGQSPSDTDTTRIIHRQGPPPTDSGGTHLPTRVIKQPPPIPGQAAYQAAYEATRISSQRPDEDKTVVLGPVTRRKQSAAAAPMQPAYAEASPEKSDHMHDPVVGWLAIVTGPGAGDFVRMGYGMNSIGRAEDQRCRLDFGDEKISRQSHATITYDPRGRKFFLQHGGGQNLTYLNNTPVLQPVEVKGGEFIVIGDTTLRFVPLCGADFDYPDVPANAHETT